MPNSLPKAPRVTVIGDGAMGTVCALILAEKGLPTTLWGIEFDRLDAMRRTRTNSRYLPGVTLPEKLQYQADAATALAGAQLVVSAVPTQFLRSVMTRMAPLMPSGVPVVSVTKGVEISTMERPSEILADTLGDRPLVVLSGPSVASEMAARMTCLMVAATPDAALRVWVQTLFTTSYLRVYRSDDILGVEMAGATKNVIAIAAGILDGMHAGNNAKAALLARGLVEITRLGVAMGAKPETFTGLAGLGDLVTTCVAPEGRNRSFGELIGKGHTADEALQKLAGVVEGMPTARAVVELAQRYKVDMPITRALYSVLFENVSPTKALHQLMTRDLKDEDVL